MHSSSPYWYAYVLPYNRAYMHVPVKHHYIQGANTSVPATPTTLLTRPTVAASSVGPTVPAIAKIVATTSTQAHTHSDPLAALLAMYGKEGVLNLVEERLAAQPPVQAMVELEGGPDW